MPETRRGKLEEVCQTDEFIFQKLNILQRSRCTVLFLDTTQKPKVLSNNRLTMTFEKRIKMP